MNIKLRLMIWIECILVAALFVTTQCSYSEEDAQTFMKEYSEESKRLWSIKTYKDWDYDTNLTDEAANELTEATKNYNDYQSSVYPEINKYQWKEFKNQTLKREFYFCSFLDEAALSKEKQANLSRIENEMLNIYSSATVKEYNSKDNVTLYLEDIQNKFAEDYLNTEEMNYYWTEWHNTVGRQEKDLFAQWIELENETAILNHFKNNAERWHNSFETKDFEKKMKKLYLDIEPFFKELHAYIRYKLWVAHNKNNTVMDLESPIPANYLGSVWGLDVINIESIMMPFPDEPTLDATPELQAQNYTGLKMAKTAEDFYESLGMEKLPEDFWKYSIFERDGRNMDCSPVSFRFFNGSDYRIHFCTTPIQDDLCRMYHEVGHTINYRLQASLPFFLQDSPNPGFDEAFGDTMYIFCTSPDNLKRLGLINKDIKLNKKQGINALFTLSMQDIFFAFYAYSLDFWRWEVMKGNIKPDNYNCEYWKRRIRFHGCEPPVCRDEHDLDPAAKYHIITGYQYIPYYFAVFLKYQFIRYLCKISGYNVTDDKPLVFCDVYNSKAVGEKLKKMLSLGKSVPWPDALEVLTGESDLDSAALLDYYQPLLEWLQEENKKNNVTVGWNSGHHRCRSNEKTKEG